MAADQVPKIIHPNGCLSELKEVIEGNVAALGGVGVGIAVIQVSSYTTHSKYGHFCPAFRDEIDESFLRFFSLTLILLDLIILLEV